MNIVLFDTPERKKLFPLTLTRAVAGIRMGILTARERWAKITRFQVFVLTDSYLQSLYEPITSGDYIFIDAGVIPSNDLIEKIFNLAPSHAINDEHGLIAGRVSIHSLPSIHHLHNLFSNTSRISSVKRISLPQHIFQLNEEMIRFDFSLVTKGRMSNTLLQTVNVTNPSKVFIEEGAEVSYSNLNASAGPIYIGKNAMVMEGCLVRGPFALCEGAVLKMGAKIYGASTIGPYSTGGGEIKNSVITGYSNKAHDGYLGDSVIGEWCNMGAGTSNSNLKNTGGQISMWNYEAKSFISAGAKCGVIMGDYSRTAINSSINTGTFIGVCCNVFCQGLTPKFIPDFSWGVNEKYKIEKALKDINNWKKLKNKTLDEKETQFLKHIFEDYTF